MIVRGVGMTKIFKESETREVRHVGYIHFEYLHCDVVVFDEKEGGGEEG
jgi:hypothetical protein